MVEGGARVIQSFLAAESGSHGCVDMVIITVSPTLVGDDGVGYGATLLSSDSVSAFGQSCRRDDRSDVM